jgi:hypothetical protein
MPLLRKPRVTLHGPAWAESAKSTVTVGADYPASMLCQSGYLGLPFMVPAAIMDAAWAPQPDPLIALVSTISRHLAQVAGWVPQSLDEMVFGVCQRFLPLAVEPPACNRRSKYYSWLLNAMLSVACMPPYLDSD